MGVADIWNTTANVHRASGELAVASTSPAVTVQPASPSQIRFTVPDGGATGGSQVEVTGTAPGGGVINETVLLFDGENSTMRLFETVTGLVTAGITLPMTVIAATTGGSTTARWAEIAANVMLFKADNVIRGGWDTRPHAGSEEIGACYWTLAPANAGTWLPAIGDVLVDSEGDTYEVRRVVNATGKGGVLSHYELRTEPRAGALL